MWHVHREFSYESTGERILKIGPRLPKLLSNIKQLTFLEHRVYRPMNIAQTCNQRNFHTHFSHAILPYIVVNIIKGHTYTAYESRLATSSALPAQDVADDGHELTVCSALRNWPFADDLSRGVACRRTAAPVSTLSFHPAVNNW